MRRLTNIILCFILAADYAQGQSCNCPDISVMIYSFDNSAAKPTFYKGGPATSDLYTEQQLFQIVDWKASPQFGSGGLTDVIIQKNPKIHFKTAQFTPANATTADVFPPAGNQAVAEDVDYIITGRFLHAGDHYVLQVHLEDAKIRDQFAEQSVELPTLKTAIEAGKAIAEKLSPLLETIRKYQHTVRDVKRKDQTAISARFEIGAMQKSVNTGATTFLRIRLFDCEDNAPLKNRKIEIKFLNGKSTVSPAQLTTDENGEARTMFKGADKPEEASLYVDYKYKNVTNRNSIALECGDNLKIAVGDKPGAPNYFALNGGQVFELHESPAPRMGEIAMYDKGMWTISISGFEKDMKAMKPMSMGITFAGNGKGTYGFSVNGTKETGLVPPYTSISVSSMLNGTPFQYISADCTPHGKPSECETHALEGTVTVTEFDEKNKIIKGTFSGRFVSPTGDYSTISGGFRAFMF